MTSPTQGRNTGHVHHPERYEPYDAYRGDDSEFAWFQTDTGVPPGAAPAQPAGTWPAEHYGQQGYPDEVYTAQAYIVHPQQHEGYAVPSYAVQVPTEIPQDEVTQGLRTLDPAVVVVPEPRAASEPKTESGQGYEIPETPEAGWDMGGSRRRSWVSRALLLCVLAIQAVLSLRLANTAFQDEALYLSAGHAQLDHLFNGAPLPSDYVSYFSGSPQLYPVLAAAVDGRFGLTGARVLSLLFMLGATTLLYSFTRRLFNERAALAAAALFAVTQSTVVLGFFATYDAAAIFLLAAATWLVVRTDRAPAAAVLLAAPVAVLAVGVKYATALYLPTLVVLALLTSWPHRGRGAFGRAVLLTVGLAGLAAAGLFLTDVLDGVRATTTEREHGADSALSLLAKSGLWGGLMFATACGGAVSYARRGRMNESPLALRLSGPGWRWRGLLGLVLCGTALLAPAYQVHLATSVALYKHIGFGLLFAAPMAGIGVTRLIGAHFRYPQLGIILWVSMLCMGLAQSEERFSSWASATKLNQVLREHVGDKGRYLASTPNVPVYYLRDRTDQSRWTSLYGIGYEDAQGTMHRGEAGYRKAIADGWFDLVVLDGVASPRMEKVVEDAVKRSGGYRLLGTVPFELGEGKGTYRIWVRY
ncbi:glycosyltransferase family 39 protein [Streptomyces marianii]|uniref:Phospholipid carrier-dependent glycosyltransferase n=1 Tax=Streptomyces marianii TaxID=1817406 RepID=A0A5R9E7N7_9ACTN|nr:glycosyltransferase family 39 protein [Streptomyces marianii]TLQ44254.1 phospholipid carrier-dependent glycosyltransferase [Streptomyces marianii]